MKKDLVAAIVSMAFVTALSLASPSNALADCGDLTKRLFNVEVGGARTYLTNLPSGIAITFQHGVADNGVDMMGGKVNALDFQGSAYWHNDRVFMYLATIRGTSDADIENAVTTLLSVANMDFDSNIKLIQKGGDLRCNDGLSAKIERSQIVGQSTIPILTVGVYNWKLRSRFECVQRPAQCGNLPKGSLN